MKITRAEVEHVATLARLALTEAEAEAFTAQLDQILTYMEKLNELDTRGIEPTAHAVTIAPVLREDEVRPSLPPAAALSNAPAREAECFKVPRVIE
ncbi:MAG: Asp-tRNA(Asn)/Glu-tRNA(Gln) amidotransferase subunit GatC [Deltaproteobacteria bacterium]|nr:Asp-tRNA(Asn)/Glu-tRNA(Gln) amidotransferase subunit GatC [Deltaproteobacteria bacterium]MBI3075758.1 Asp-tRNA(Asn)/Glu-tRNA(Gln) amidotransferase subunit GatC [Deltaproteobacteria bacterium]